MSQKQNIKAEAERLDVVDKTAGVLAELLFDESILQQIKDYRSLFILVRWTPVIHLCWYVIEHVAIEHVVIEHVVIEHVAIEHVVIEHVVIEHVVIEHVAALGVAILLADRANFLWVVLYMTQLVVNPVEERRAFGEYEM